MPSFADTDHQRLARERGLENRRAWRQVKLSLKAGDMSLGHALVHPAAQDRRVGELLGYCFATTKWSGPKRQIQASPARALAVCQRARINPDLPVQALSASRRFALTGVVERQSTYAYRRARQERAAA